MSWRIRSWTQDLCKGVAGNCNETETKTEQRVLTCGKKRNRLKRVAGNCNEVLCESVQGVAGICNEGLKSK